ncbi:MAG: exosortase/archaeosortase family protein [Deltaproteobacteria bacterium]
MISGIVVFLSIALSYVLFGSLFFHLIDTWKIDPFYLHGPWIAVASLFLYLRFLWLHRESQLLRLRTKDIVSAIVFLVFSALFFLFGIQTKMPFLGGLAFALWGVALHSLLFGSKEGCLPVMEYSFPFFYFLFAVPLPYLSEASGLLQLFIAKLSTNIFSGLGYPIRQEGINLILPHASFQIAPDCTGIKSWLVLFSLVVFFLTFIRLKFCFKILISFLIVPVAFFSNMFRIIVLLLLGFHKDEKIALAFWHDFSGITFYGVACFLTLLMVWALIRYDRTT